MVSCRQPRPLSLQPLAALKLAMPPEGTEQEVRETGLRALIGPAALATAFFIAYALASAAAQWLGLSSGGAGALTLRDMTGVCAWLALAWSCARLFDVLLRRAAAVSRRPAPYPRLLADLVRVALFVAASVAILLFVFEGSASVELAHYRSFTGLLRRSNRGLIAR